MVGSSPQITSSPRATSTNTRPGRTGVTAADLLLTPAPFVRMPNKLVVCIMTACDTTLAVIIWLRPVGRGRIDCVPRLELEIDAGRQN